MGQLEEKMTQPLPSPQGSDVEVQEPLPQPTADTITYTNHRSLDDIFPPMTLLTQCAARTIASSIIDQRLEYMGFPIITALLLSIFDYTACSNDKNCFQNALTRIWIYTVFNIPINACIQTYTVPKNQLIWLYPIEIVIAIVMSCALCHTAKSGQGNELTDSEPSNHSRQDHREGDSFLGENSLYDLVQQEQLARQQYQKLRTP